MSKTEKLFKGGGGSSYSKGRGKGGPTPQEALAREMLTKKQEDLEARIEKELAVPKKHGPRDARDYFTENMTEGEGVAPENAIRVLTEYVNNFDMEIRQPQALPNQNIINRAEDINAAPSTSSSLSKALKKTNAVPESQGGGAGNPQQLMGAIVNIQPGGTGNPQQWMCAVANTLPGGTEYSQPLTVAVANHQPGGVGNPQRRTAAATKLKEEGEPCGKKKKKAAPVRVVEEAGGDADLQPVGQPNTPNKRALSAVSIEAVEPGDGGDIFKKWYEYTQECQAITSRIRECDKGIEKLKQIKKAAIAEYFALAKKHDLIIKNGNQH